MALKIATMYNEATRLSEAQKDLPLDAPRILKKVVWNGGRPVYEALEAQVEEISEDKVVEPYFARTAEIAVRLATIVAWGCGRMEVIREDMEWGRDVALWSANNMAISAMTYMAENEHQKMYAKIVRMIESGGAKGLTRRDLLQRLRGAIKTKELEDMLKMAEESGEIELKKAMPTKGGHPVVTYKKSKKSK